jgi:hypothetical protein
LVELTIAEAGAALGLSVDTVRRRLRSGQLKSRTDPRGRVLVQLETPLPGVAAQTGLGARSAELEAEIGRLREQLEAALAERDWLRARVETAEQEREQLRTLLANAQQQLSQLVSAPADPSESAPRQGRRWW